MGEPIRVLHILQRMEAGGTQALLIQYNINNKEFIVGSTALVLSAGLMFIDNRFGFLLQCVILAVTIYLFSDIWLPIVRKILKLKGRR